MTGKMLIPLDGSELAEVVLPYAERLAGELGYEIILLNVRHPAENPEFPELKSYLEKKVETTKQHIEDMSQKSNNEVRVEKEIIGSGIIVNHPAEGILDYADKENISLIVMATHGRTGIKRWALGSTAEKVLSASSHPILLVRANYDMQKEFLPNNILVPLDGSKQSEVVLPYIENIVSKLKSKVILLHVIEQPYHFYASTEGVVEVLYTEEELEAKKMDAISYLERVGALLIGKVIQTSTQIKVGKADMEIIKLAGEPEIDMVAMSTNGYSGYSRWEHGGIADKVLHGGNKPLLLLREPI